MVKILELLPKDNFKVQLINNKGEPIIGDNTTLVVDKDYFQKRKLNVNVSLVRAEILEIAQRQLGIWVVKDKYLNKFNIPTAEVQEKLNKAKESKVKEKKVKEPKVKEKKSKGIRSQGKKEETRNK